MPHPALKDIDEAVQEHLSSSIYWKGLKSAVAEMNRQYANYFKGISNFKEIKTQLVTSNDLGELNEILEKLHQDSEKFEFVLS